ncbi:AAA family ATPase [Actinoplanes sp. N902-109]|uniref:AAA family ATPase n=1 Tax=Actinoplanes sp. (strain N902-109) TaxID=649831 RepID=UPI000329500B|nr:AAA family ATPase [Actinoplanes sp. N902-109]AGL16414.1 LuxR-family transcriptional regulator [Actinoplanes sp. N902-109]
MDVVEQGRDQPNPVATGPSADGSIDNCERTDELVEREKALSVLQQALRRSNGGRARTVLVQGATGTGKSALVWRFLEKAESTGVLAFGVHISPGESSLAPETLRSMFGNPAAPYGFRLLVDSRLAAPGTGTGRPTGAELIGRLRDIAADLVDLAESVPLLLVIDDIHHLDTESLDALLHLLPTASASRILVVLTADEEWHPLRWHMPTGLLMRPNLRRVALNNLSPRGVRQVVAGRLGAAADTLTADLIALSAGNPLVLGHLLRAHETTGDGYPQGYGQALVECLHRCPPETVEVVRAMAVLGDQASPERVAGLAGVAIDGALVGLQSLTTAGLLDLRGFRHPSGIGAILGDMPAEARAVQHRRAALLLHDEGESALDVARHLVQADEQQLPWVNDLLLDAANEALTLNEVQLAVECVRLARRAQSDPAARAAVDVWLSRLEWQLKPLAAGRHMQRQLEDGATGGLSHRDTLDLVWRKAWFGQVDQIEPLLATVGRANDGADLTDLLSWLSFTFPARRFHQRMTVPPEPAPTDEPWLHSAAGLARWLTDGATDHGVTDAELVLQSFALDRDSLWSGETAALALLTLVYADHLDAAIAHADRLLAEARDAGMTAWHALFTAVRAEALFRRGDLPGAFAQALAALGEIPAEGWGAVVGLPLGCAIHAAVRMGDRATAKRLVSRSLPEIALRTRYGLHYLHARGHYRLALGLPQPALADFLACGNLTEGWGAHGVAVVPWRTSAAEAWSAAGSPDQARRMLRDQLAVLPPGSGRARGQALRVLACVSRESRRPQLLTDAVDLLKTCGDKYELARALTDLSVAFRQAGDQRKGRRTARRAVHFAMAAGAEPLASEAAPYEHDTDTIVPPRAETGKLALLTDQELRVTALAVDGDTNHEIAAKLHITPSTVEQHLTRVFRKLSIKSRDELPHQLGIWQPHGAA